MIALIQRVSTAAVHARGELIGEIGSGLLALIGIEQGDGQPQVERLLQRLLGYRVFADAQGKMNLGLQETRGGLLLVPQFTLAAETRKGMRPGFSRAAAPDEGERLFNLLLELACQQHAPVATGDFGADMQVSLVNEGPVTFWLQVPPDAQ
ncbi:D-aminoacyl-tRNA deacylase [Thiohalophilus sp.]|uniref:D-aminoacyl-tRNA deacylase n=1 Tax=Thiohalophilus sp. TaxID=3028392 RepID=UPI002ACEDAE0|nr:D-aminoacyl-tRNA deacylase [Thiohalophilus sp.]MDZ7804744.1 D-aminoacyl-tRNA deacylase [Thiohalophilus sp.]